MQIKFVTCSILAFFTNAFSPLSGQSLSPEVVASAGAGFSHPTLGTLNWTLGEPMVETWSPGLVLTQGFHQVYYDLVPVFPEPSPQLNIRIYPNPTAGGVTLETAPYHQGLVLDVYNLVGQRVRTVDVIQEKQTLDVGHLPPGLYLFTFRNDKVIFHTLRVKKTNI